MIPRREFLAGVAATGLMQSGCSLAAATAGALTPEDFGAKGDGRTNDTAAFAALSAHVNRIGGGTVVLRPVTYIVGDQARATGSRRNFAFAPADILHFVGCARPIVIRGNGATLRCSPGLRYGGFDSISGRPLPESRSNLDRNKRAIPYLGMIHAENCSGGIEISDLELDGNLQALHVGGRYGNGGWEAGGSGIRFNGNSGPERLSRIRSHHHAQDGIIFDGAPNRSGATIVSDVVCDSNGRQGCSIVSGRDYVFERCKFVRTGKGGLRSSPAAGVDIEAEGGKTIRNLAFTDCEFSDNSGFGLVAGGGDSEGATFTNCKFVGTTNWAAWPKKPRFRFAGCLFVGQFINAYGDRDPARAAQFADCTFTDDAAQSPTGEVYLGRNPSRAITILLDNPNVQFSRCRFTLVGDAILPMSKADVIYADCTMSQGSPRPSRPIGTYLGTNSISGNAKLAGSVIRGSVILNGRKLAAGEVAPR